ncbi:hypothetical protein HQ587_03805 [bacterium]|nr:hypothetical protein [bacterium]
MSDIRNSAMFGVISIIVLVSLGVTIFGVDIVLAKSMTVKAGTPVMLQFQQAVNSKFNDVGDKPNVIVMQDVVVDGSVVIRGGSPAVATVIKAQKAGAVGASGVIEVEITGVHAVDGTLIRISGARISEEGRDKQTESIVITLLCCILALLMTGEPGEILAGTQVTGYTIANMDVTMEE